MPADDIMLLREELSSMKRILASMGKMGRVMKVEKGRILVDYGPGDAGDNGKKLNGVWIRTAHGGGECNSPRFSEGETVSTWAVGGNPEHCHVVRSGFNDAHPRDGNDTDDSSTRRWRKKPDQQQGSDQGGDQGGGDGQYGMGHNNGPTWKDDEEDHQEIHDRDQRTVKIGKYQHKATKDGGEMRYDKTFVRNNKGKIEIGNGDDVHFVYEDGKIQVKCEIVDKNGNKFAVQGTVDSRGDVLNSKFAND